MHTVKDAIRELSRAGELITVTTTVIDVISLTPGFTRVRLHSDDLSA